MSTLSFGVGSGEGIYGPESYAGSDGPVPPAGAYYLAVGEYGTTFYEYNFEVEGAGSGGTYHIMVYTDTNLLPPIEHDFGRVNSIGSDYSGYLDPNEVLFFTIYLTSFETFLEIDTYWSEIDDTMIALYNPFGELIAMDDDGGEGTKSMLSFGAGEKNGDVDNLGGTYFLVLGEYHASFTDYIVDVKSTGADLGGDYHISISADSTCDPWDECTSGGSAGCNYCVLSRSSARRLRCLKLDDDEYILFEKGCDPPYDTPTRSYCFAPAWVCD